MKSKNGSTFCIEELKSKGISDSSIQKVEPFFDFKGSATEKLEFLYSQLSSSVVGIEGVDEIKQVIELAGVDSLEVDITLARGLNYYTGAIFEVTAEDTTIGSVCGGGRYDDLTGIFGLPDISGVGISFGIDRIYDIMLEQSQFDKLDLQNTATQVFFINFGGKELKHCLSVANSLREAGISTEVYPDEVKMKSKWHMLMRTTFHG